MDLSDAVVVAPPTLSGPESKAVTLLVEEVEKRTQIFWPVVDSERGAKGPVVAVRGDGRGPAEGYQVRARGTAVAVTGNDRRGVLFGTGRLLRSLHMTRGAVTLPGDLDVTTAPRYPLRGHQLGYRPKTNSYDGWTLVLWEQYIRDLAVFGTNAIELIPPRSDDDRDSPHFPLPPMQTMAGMSQICADYGLDVWIWYPAMGGGYADPGTVASALEEWDEVFRKLPRVDAVFVPGGDPGHTHPKHLMALLEKQAESLRRRHRGAQMWVSPQSFGKAWLDEFLAIVRQEPSWLAGVVFGPETHMSLADLRAAVPERYPIRHYPDITHTTFCQYPVPDWDLAYALTQGREPINPRPAYQAGLFRALQPHTNGSVCYSEGCNDDVNKVVWSALGWDPDADVTDILREYSQYFLGPRYRDTFAQALLALERNWQGPLLTNTGVPVTLRQLQAMEREAAPQDRRNWRFQQALYRAHYDAHVRGRLVYETALEEQALHLLRDAERLGSLAALAEAERVLDRAVTHPVATDWRARVFELAEALFQSIRMQLSVPRYQAIAVRRGANLDTIDAPLNNRPWLKGRFAEIRERPGERERLRGIEEIVGWSDPGPGGFYDDLGGPTPPPHLAHPPARAGFAWQYPGPARTSWMTAQGGNLIDGPLRLAYPNLDPAARYAVRVLYASRRRPLDIRLEAGGRELHPLQPPLSSGQPVEFDIPAGSLQDGTLTLEWSTPPDVRGDGYSCLVSEVWLVRKGDAGTQ